jgi:hypothetical protein
MYTEEHTKKVIKNPDKSIYDFEYPGSDEAKTKRGGGCISLLQRNKIMNKKTHAYIFKI